MPNAQLTSKEVTRRETLRFLSLAAEYRDDQTYEHTQRVGRTSALVAQTTRAGRVSSCELIRHAAPLHDVGTSGSRLDPLNPHKLTPHQFEIVRRHGESGARISPAAAPSC